MRLATTHTKFDRADGGGIRVWLVVVAAVSQDGGRKFKPLASASPSLRRACADREILMDTMDRLDIRIDGLLPTLLLVLFVGLKLTGQIDWSWWWGLSPVWIPFAVGLPVLIVIIFFAALRP